MRLYIPWWPFLKENRKQTVWWKFWSISKCYETLHNYKYDVVSEASKCKQVIYLHPHPPSPSHMKPLGLARISINICSNLLRRRLFPPSFSQPPSCPLGSCCFSRNATPPSSNPPTPPRTKDPLHPVMCFLNKSTSTLFIFANYSALHAWHILSHLIFFFIFHSFVNLPGGILGLSVDYHSLSCDHLHFLHHQPHPPFLRTRTFVQLQPVLSCYPSPTFKLASLLTFKITVTSEETLRYLVLNESLPNCSPPKSLIFTWRSPSK